jgi:hypothetical protein
MIRILRGILMLDEVPTGDKAVYIFLEMTALGFVLEAVAALVRGDAWWKWAGAFLLGASFLLLGVKWPLLKEKLVWFKPLGAISLGKMRVLFLVPAVILLVVGYQLYPVLSKGKVVLSHGNKELNGQTIDTGGRSDVLNGLIVPSLQITATKTTAPLSVRLYLSEGDARWNGPWEPTESDDKEFPAEFHWGGPQVSSQETWNTPEFIVQRNKGVPFDRLISARIKVFYGAAKPVLADFWLRNNS